MCICTLHHVELHYLRSCTIQWLGRADVDINNPFFLLLLPPRRRRRLPKEEQEEGI